MKRYYMSRALSVSCIVGLVLAFGPVAWGDNIVVNSTFAPAAEGKLPEGWAVVKPVWEKAACRVRRVDEGLLIDGLADPYAVGGVVQEV
ncbi:MAG: hypothetical protein JSU70_18160, partial [Phycisphaerales bacterium]